MTGKYDSFLTLLHDQLQDSFDLEEIRTLCLQLNINYESVAGGDLLPAKTRELILRFAREGRLPELVTAVAQSRPDKYWPPVPPDFQLPASGPWHPADTTAAQTTVHGDIVHGNKVGGHNVGGNLITVVGDGNAVGENARAETHIQQGIPPEQLNTLFGPLLQQVAQQAPAGQQATAVAKVNELKEETAKGEDADDEAVAGLVQDIVAIAPTAVETITNLFTNVLIAKSAGAVTKFVLRRLSPEP